MRGYPLWSADVKAPGALNPPQSKNYQDVFYFLSAGVGMGKVRACRPKVGSHRSRGRRNLASIVPDTVDEKIVV